MKTRSFRFKRASNAGAYIFQLAPACEPDDQFTLTLLPLNEADVTIPARIGPTGWPEKHLLVDGTRQLPERTSPRMTQGRE
jgi:hypothetical protein